MKQLSFLIALLFISNLFFSQEETSRKVTPEGAASKMKLENYEDALDDYLELLNDDPKNELYNYSVGVCYLNSNINKTKATPYLEIVTRLDKYNPQADYLLGRAYQFSNRFDDAIKMFKNYKTYLEHNPKGINKDVDEQIQYCLNAKELIKYPIDVTFQALGKNINTEYKDYYPFVTEDESFIIYNSKRPGKNNFKLANGDYVNSIYMSKVINGQYTKATSISSLAVDATAAMEVIGLSAHGDVMLLLNTKGKGNIYTSHLSPDGTYSKPEPLDKIMNSKGDEIAASISADGSTIYFASNREGGLGGTDIYSCKKLSNGKWAAPQNLGASVNTPSDEDFPNISPDGKTLYFSSKGHASMGGYDIFKSTFDEVTNTFTSAKNIGYPVNTTYDDMNFRISKNGKYGYIAAVRPNGLGDYDIYRVNFNEVETEYTVLIGETKSSKNETLNYSDVFISVTSEANNDLIGNYLPNPASGRFIVILPPGKYKMTVEAPGFKLLEKALEILDKSSYQAEINLTIELSK